MQAAFRQHVPNNAFSCYKRVRGNANKVKKIIRQKLKDVTMKNICLGFTFSTSLMDNTLKFPLETQKTASAQLASSTTISGDATSGDNNKKTVVNVVDLREEVLAAVERKDIALLNLLPNLNHQEHNLLPGERGDRPLTRHVPSV